MKLLIVVVAMIILLSGPSLSGPLYAADHDAADHSAADQDAADSGRVGTISFPTSASGEAQVRFLRGVSILHSFGWKQAKQEFQAAQKLDPDFALAYWGESLCYNHPLIKESDLESPRAVLKKLGDTQQERLAKAPTDREKGFVLAVDALFFGEGDSMARRTAYMSVMRGLHEEYPEDDEVAAFYALSLLMSAGPAGGSGHRSNVLAGAIATQLMQRNPDHPGAAHYTIHAFDDPVHAPLALGAAYVFADIAESVSHARHMPTHIFIQHGMWDLVSSHNQSAYEAATDLYEPGDRVNDMVHALNWGQYGDLQRGDYQRAQLWIDRMEQISTMVKDQPRAAGTLNVVKARLTIETQDWKLQRLDGSSSGPILLATGISAVKLGDLELASEAAELLDQAVKKAAADNDRSYYARNSKPLQIMYNEVQGLIEIARGHTEKGLNLLKEGVAIAESMRPPNGAPNPIKPPHELYAEALLEADMPAEALVLFDASLLRTPNRPASLLGAARTYVALGNPDAARLKYSKLAEIWHPREVPALEEANRYLASVSGE